MKAKQRYYYIANHKNTKFLCSTAVDISSITHEFQKAMIFKNDVRPRQIIRMLPKAIRKYGPFEIHMFKDDEIETMTSGTTTLVETKSVVESVEMKTSIDLQEKAEVKVECKTEFNYEEIKNELNSFAPKLKSIINQQVELKKELSDIEIQDILHYIEFHRFSACEGYKLAKMLQVARDKRRVIKNKLEVINIFKTSTCTSISSGHLVNRLDSIDNKIYKPRILDELFENGENKKRENVNS